MNLKEKLSEDMKSAMKAKEQKKLMVLRMILSEIKYAQAQTNAHTDLPEADVLKVVEGYAKKLEKGLNDFPEGEKKAEIRNEIDIVRAYLPKKAGDAETRTAIEAVLAETADRNFGALMKLVQTKLAGNGDGKLISEILKSKL